MKIPKSCRVYGREYDVVLVDGYDEGKYVGRLFDHNDTILISKSDDKGNPISEDSMAVTFFHECMHAVDPTIKEDIINRLSRGVYAVCKENKLRFDGGDKDAVGKRKVKEGRVRKHKETKE